VDDRFEFAHYRIALFRQSFVEVFQITVQVDSDLFESGDFML
jgi:hypothetical protein